MRKTNAQIRKEVIASLSVIVQTSLDMKPQARGSFIINQFTRELGYIFPDTYAHQALSRKKKKQS